MSKTPQARMPIKIARHPKDGNCFVCGRTPEEIDGFVDVPGLKSEIATALGKEKRRIDEINPDLFRPAKTRFDTTTMLIPYDLLGQKLSTARSYPHYELQYQREGSQARVDPAEVVEVTFHLPVCPFCSKLLDDASKAAYKTIHAQEYCEDD